ncbi:hypothetical protein TRAPUB_8079 [Trametes pubescens]|uniref:Uncharacterized protein n=1 Tax=Trametes pubescens TaxID=154538 RepID=A0A1M2W694_TRAPU|nr:hypothetical protein TRAPUB_8079 [Trametes pubescens]
MSPFAEARANFVMIGDGLELIDPAEADPYADGFNADTEAFKRPKGLTDWDWRVLRNF